MWQDTWNWREKENYNDYIKREGSKLWEEILFLCKAVEDENKFETGAMTNENLLNARNTYRVTMELLTLYSTANMDY